MKQRCDGSNRLARSRSRGCSCYASSSGIGTGTIQHSGSWNCSSKLAALPDCSSPTIWMPAQAQTADLGKSAEANLRAPGKSCDFANPFFGSAFLTHVNVDTQLPQEFRISELKKYFRDHATTPILFAETTGFAVCKRLYCALWTRLEWGRLPGFWGHRVPA